MIKRNLSHDQCGSVGWALFCKAKGHQLDSWSGHMPGLQSIDVSLLSFSLPSPLSKNKVFFLKGEKFEH